MHQACTRSIFLNAPNMVEPRIHFLVRFSSVFCKILHETATRQLIVTPALFRVCANVHLVNVLGTFLFLSIFVKSEYATFLMVRASRVKSAINKNIAFIVSACNSRSATAGFLCNCLQTFAGITKRCVRARIWRVRFLTNEKKLGSVTCDQHDGVRWS